MINTSASHSAHAPISKELRRYLDLTLGKDEGDDSHHYLYRALVHTVRDQLLARWRETRRQSLESPHRIGYLSLEFLVGRSLHNAILNLDLEEPVREALKEYACGLEQIESEEMDAGLGNGGLGRLAACFLDSCASMDIPVVGYGIRYQYGMFHQQIEDGYQVESPDLWLRKGNPWEIEAPEHTRRIKFMGRSEHFYDAGGQLKARWVDTQDVLAVPYDMPVPGYQNARVNTLRLWKSEATDEFNLEEFNAGDYSDAVAAKNLAEQISMVLYPNDYSVQGKELRLRQQYFLASASLQDTLCFWARHFDGDFAGFAETNSFQLNDTHPAIAVAELMRLLLDEYDKDWTEAWSITTQTMAYTNHTLLPEALETWSVELMGCLLPRLMEIIYEINARFLTQVAERWPGDTERQRRMSIIAEGNHRHVRMAHLAIVGSYSINGVAALHTELLEKNLFHDFYELWPHKFNNKTNGVTPRRWLAHCNPGLKSLLVETIGDGWVKDLSQLEKLKPFAQDRSFTEKFMLVKRVNKERLAKMVTKSCCVDFDPDMIFDVQVKRIHEYKRQLLNVLHVIHLYIRILQGETHGMHPRCVLIGGKAAPGYHTAKLIIKLVNNVAAVVNRDPRVRNWLRVAFFPDYRVTAMEVICPGTDLSEQISTAGKEASGTGNMKFMMSGAVTIGTLDGANIEIRDAVGADNYFLFGMDASEVELARVNYDPNYVIAHDERLMQVMHLLESGHFNLFEAGLFKPIVDAIRSATDPWMTAADFHSYVEAQQRVSETFQDTSRWSRISVLNTASSGFFSSDRTIAEYRDQIWMKNKK
ncbi:glycogen/starch/alpha-glucan phosphorylase [Pseudomaricurvus hydrocarbonicus]